MDDAGAAPLNDPRPDDSPPAGLTPTGLPATGQAAVAAARARRDHLDDRLRAFVVPDGPAAELTAAIRTGSGRSHEVGSGVNAADPCGSPAPRHSERSAGGGSAGGGSAGGGSAGTRTPAAGRGGLLDGLPIAVKGQRGIRTPAVRRLLAAGAVPIGATSVPRGGGYQTWGWTDRGPTRNPWRSDRSPGGSSAGSAAAVAAGIVRLATGSDGAGSVRIPAAWCGVLGYKPTAGLVPGTDPTGLAVPGVLVRDPRLLRPWLDAVREPLPAGQPGSPAAPLRRGVRGEVGAWGAAGLRRVAWSADLGVVTDLDDETVALARAAADRLVTRAGLVEVPVALRLRDPGPAWAALRSPAPPGATGPAGHDRHTLPARRTTTTGAGAGAGAANDSALAEFFGVADLLLTPTTPGGPHGHDGPGERMNVSMTWAFNLSGHPAASVPAGYDRDGLPVGLQLVARPGADPQLLDLLERHVPPAPVAPSP